MVNLQIDARCAGRHKINEEAERSERRPLVLVRSVRGLSVGNRKKKAFPLVEAPSEQTNRVYTSRYFNTGPRDARWTDKGLRRRRAEGREGLM